MKNKKRKCPHCGAMVPASSKICPKCGAVLNSGRVETLPKTDKAKREEEALRNLPRPVRPTEELERPEPEERSSGREIPRSGENASSQREGTGSSSGGKTPRPVETARSSDYYQRSERRTWQIAAVLAVILVIIVIAIVLVIRLNERPSAPNAEGKEPSPEFEVEEPSASPAPTGTPLITPIPSPSSTPQSAVVIATPTPTVSPLATPTPTPVPTASSSPLPFTVTPVNETVYLTGGGVNIRKGPGTDYEIIGNESTGYTFTRTGRVGNGWSRVIYNGSDAYVSDSFLSTSQPSASPAPSYTVTGASGTVTVASDANLRKGPGTDYESVGVVATGTQLTRTGITGSWTRVQYNGQELFIYTTLVTEGSGSGTTGGTVTITGNLVNVRSGPGTNYNAIGSVNSGTTLTCTGQSGDWYQVTYNGQTGYVSTSYATRN